MFLLSQLVVTLSFTRQMYRVSEDNETAVICVNKDGEVEGSISIRIESQEKDPPEAQGKILCCNETLLNSLSLYCNCIQVLWILLKTLKR